MSGQKVNCLACTGFILALEQKLQQFPHPKTVLLFLNACLWVYDALRSQEIFLQNHFSVLHIYKWAYYHLKSESNLLLFVYLIISATQIYYTGALKKVQCHIYNVVIICTDFTLYPLSFTETFSDVCCTAIRAIIWRCTVTGNFHMYHGNQTFPSIKIQIFLQSTFWIVLKI
jgi:hypothetical protein